MAVTPSSADHVNNIEKENNQDVIEIEIPFPLFQYLSSNECYLQNICRICLSVNDPILYPLFSSDEQCVLATMVMAISEVQMSAEDGLPGNICPRCQTEVLNYYEFKMKCVKSDYTLKSVLKGEFVSEQKSPTNNNVDNTQINTESQIERDDCKMSTIENDAGPIQPIKEENAGLDYLENLKDTMSDDEALCVVRETLNNQKEITILDKAPKSLIKNIVKPNRRRGKKVKPQCTFCRKKFGNAKLLKAHIRKRHPTLVSVRPYPCKDCKEAFDSEFDLNVHGMLHNQESGWKCTECQKDYKGRSALRRHIERHMRRRRFVCEHCGASFVEKYALRRHLRIHFPLASEKNHACTQCDKR